MTEDQAGRRPPADAEGFEGLTDEVLPALIARLRASRLGEIEVRTADWHVRLRRDPNAKPRSTPPQRDGHSSDSAEDLGGGIARSPAVGYFTPAPDLAVGRSVIAGDLLGSIDVLGIGQEVSAPEDGVIATILAEDGQAVEYGQALAEIDPIELDDLSDDAGDLSR